MSTYRYTLSEYQAVKEADLTIDGLTVLAGENGCGKSTLSRWLYYLVNGVQRFETFTIREYVQKVERLIRQHSMAAREISPYIQVDEKMQNMMRFAPVKVFSNSTYDDDTVHLVQDQFVQSVHVLGDMLAEYLQNAPQSARRDRIMMYLNMGVMGDVTIEAKQVAEDFVDKNMRLLHQMTEKLNSDIESRSLDRFLNNIRHEYGEHDAVPEHMQLYEDSVELVEGNRVASLFNLSRAIYIDTPMALTNESAENVFWNELRRMVLQRKQELELPEKKLLRRIKNILHGEARMIEIDTPFGGEELRFVSDDGKVNIEIERAATGFKTFTYLQRLLENGFLGEDSLLLIDEPEAHLHPQWIVEYARILVLLHKELGQKIMVATHNPDMVAALKAIAEREGVIDKTHFYIARTSEQQSGYTYKDLGADISEIFTSFNIALSRIESYGTISLQQ